MIFYGKTDVGKKREENQDRFGHIQLDNGMTLLAVCDGMGGANGGETAAELAIDIFLSDCKENITSALEDSRMRSVLSLAVQSANSAIFQKAEENEALSGMGTTLVSALVDETNKRIYIINAGDSRAYLISGAECTQLSHDHSYVQYLIDKGELTPAKAAKHPEKNLITKAVGTSEAVRPDIDIFDFPTYDSPAYLLLCTDGLTGQVKDKDIQKYLISDKTIEEKADGLIALANKKGGPDNITVLIASL